MEALGAVGACQRIARPAASSTRQMQKAEGTPEPPICAVTQRQLSYLHSGNQDRLHPVCPKLSLLKANKPLPSECPDFQKRKIEGVSVLRRGCWGHQQRVKRGGGSGQLEPHQTLPAILSSQNSSSLWLQSHYSSLYQALPSAGLWEAWATPGPPSQFIPGRNIREKQTQPLLL